MLALASVRGRRSSFIGTFAALALGVGLLTTTLLVYASATPTVPSRLSHAAVVVHSPLTEDPVSKDFRPWTSAQAEQLAERLGDAVIDRTFYAQLAGRPEAEGHGWSSTRLGAYQLMGGAVPTSDNEVALDAALGAKPGDVVTMLFAQGSREMTVTGVVNGPGIYVSDAQAAQLAPGVKMIGLVNPANLSNMDLMGGTAVTGDARSLFEPEEKGRTRWLGAQLLSAMALLGVFVTVFIVASTFALSAAQRRRELGLLRTVGATSRQVRRLILGEALIVGGVAALAGAVLGALAAPALGRQLVHWGLENGDFQVSLMAWPILTAWLVGVTVGVLGAWSASRRSAKVRPIESLREATVEKRPMTLGRWILGGGALALGGWLAVTATTAKAEDRVDAALFTAMALIVAASLLAPVVIPPLVRLVTWPFQRGPMGLVVRAEMLNAVRRTASTSAPIIATVGFATMLTGMVLTMQSAYPDGKAAELAGQTVVVPDGTPGLTDEAVAAAGPGLLSTRVYVGQQWLEAAGDPRITSTSDAIVPGKPVGSLYPVTFADGVAGKLKVIAGNPGEYDLVMSRELARAHDPSALTPMVFGGKAAATGAKVVDAQTYAEAEFAEDSRLLWLFAMVLIGLSVGYTGISILNTMVMASSGRRQDFAVLRSAGATTRQVVRFVAAETAIVVALGVGLGLLVTIPPLAAMAAGLREELAVPVSLTLHGPSLTVVIGACFLLAIAASTTSAWRTLRRS